MFSSYLNTIKHSVIYNKQDELKAILKLNNMIISELNGFQIGGTLADQQQLQDMVKNLTDKIQDIKTSHASLEEGVQAKEDLQKLIVVIHYIHSKIPNDSAIGMLDTQMKEIERIINKY
jgi:hypothetical protein